MTPNFTVSLAVNHNLEVSSAYGVVFKSPMGGMVIDLGRDPFLVAFTSPCCASLLSTVTVKPRSGEVYEVTACTWCHAEYEFLPSGQLWPGQVLDGLESYGEALGWWTDPLETVMGATDLLVKLNRVGEESNGRYSIYTSSWHSRAQTITAGLKMLHREGEIDWAFDPVILDYSIGFPALSLTSAVR